MRSSSRKRGRPVAIYTTSWGEAIQGLLRRSDGRWKISETGKTFTEPDERLAVARFLSYTRPKEAEVAISDATTAAGMASLGPTLAPVDGIPADVIPAVVEKGRISLLRAIPELAMWAWMREQILARPEYAARMTGIEQLGYLSELERPRPSAQLEDLGKLYIAKPGLSVNEAGRSKLFWGEFCRGVGVQTVREVTHDAVRQYEAVILGQGLAPKSIKHRYGKIRTILAYAIRRGESVEDCRRALDTCAMLESRGATSLDPNPIEPKQFWAIHAAAAEKGDATFAAIMLVAANACMHGSEVSALRWQEVDLDAAELVTSRRKTGVSRVAILWPETVAALRELPQDRDTIFNTRVRSFTTHSVASHFARYRAVAGFGKSVTFSMIRDAAYTIACRSVTLDKARILAGHRLPGATDHYYVKRNPGFVREACEAIRLGFASGCGY